jgi:hypothetical protein
MSQQVMYRRCELTKRVSDGVLIQQSWIPSKFAMVGRVLELKNGAGEWENGWRVDWTSDVERPENVLVARSRDHVKHQKNDGRV